MNVNDDEFNEYVKFVDSYQKSGSTKNRKMTDKRKSKKDENKNDYKIDEEEEEEEEF